MIQNIYNQPFPVIEINDEYVLREQDLRDTEAFFQYYNDPEVNQYILASVPKNLSDANAEVHYCRNLFRYRRGVYWTLAERKTDKMVGAAGLYINNQHHRAEICYELAKPYWRKGIMLQTLTKVLHFAFENTDMQRIEALTMRDNIASSAILMKLGFQHEGELKNYRYFNDRSYNVDIYAITPEMWRYHCKNS